MITSFGTQLDIRNTVDSEDVGSFDFIKANNAFHVVWTLQSNEFWASITYEGKRISSGYFRTNKMDNMLESINYIITGYVIDNL